MRTLKELVASGISYPLRAGTLRGYSEFFKPKDAITELKQFTQSSLLLREHINKQFDVDQGAIRQASKMEKLTIYLSGLPEVIMAKTVWMPIMETSFKDLTGQEFNREQFVNDPAYRTKYERQIKESGSVADATIEKIIGSTVKGGGRREVEYLPGKSTKKDNAIGQTIGMFGNYGHRELHEFMNAFREFGEKAKAGEGVNSVTALAKPLAIIMNLAAYGFAGSLMYAGKNILLGKANDDKDLEKYGQDMMDSRLSTKGLLQEVGGNLVQLAGSKYGSISRTLIQTLGTIAMSGTDDKETKDAVYQFVKGTTFLSPTDFSKFYTEGNTKERMSSLVVQNILPLATIVNRLTDMVGGVKEASKLMRQYKNDELTGDSKEWAMAFDAVFKITQAFLTIKGTSIPMYQDLKAILKTDGDSKKADVYQQRSDLIKSISTNIINGTKLDTATQTQMRNFGVSNDEINKEIEKQKTPVAEQKFKNAETGDKITIWNKATEEQRKALAQHVPTVKTLETFAERYGKSLLQPGSKLLQSFNVMMVIAKQKELDKDAGLSTDD